MKIDRVKLDLSIVAGILLTLVVSIILGFVLVGGFLINTDNINAPLNLGYQRSQVIIKGADKYMSGNNVIVSVAQNTCSVMDTEKGSIEIYDYNLPDVLPLCITQEVLDNYYVTVAVTGGYEPIDGSITLWQKGELKGVIDVDWIYLGHEPCYTDYWSAVFSLPDGVSSIELESNQWPDGALPVYPEYCTIPGKQVVIDVDTIWQGCTLEEKQRFELIQIHQQVFNKSPTPHEVIIILIAS